MENTITDNRQFHRIFYSADATLHAKSIKHACKIVDISLKGCLLRFDEPWINPIESLYTLSFQLSETISIAMEVSVSHVIGNEAGFKCEHIDIDSISQLRRLVELNLGNSEMLERDLLALTNTYDNG